MFDIPKHEEEPARQMIYFIKDDLLAASDNLKVIEGMLGRLAQTRNDSLAAVPAFEAITKRCRTGAGELVPHIRWFIEPFGYADAVRLSSDQPARRAPTCSRFFASRASRRSKASAGFVNFSVDQYEMLHRTFIYAPGNKTGGERFTLAARMLEFPNGGNFTPPDWVPRDVASYMRGQPEHEERLRKFQDAGQRDRRRRSVRRRAGVDSHRRKWPADRHPQGSDRLPGQPRSRSSPTCNCPSRPRASGCWSAVDTTDEKHLAEVIKKWMETDPDTRRREINGHVVWEIVDEKAELPMVTIENSPLDADCRQAERGRGRKAACCRTRP